MGFQRKGPPTDPRQGAARAERDNDFFATRLLGQVGFVLGSVFGAIALVLMGVLLFSDSAGSRAIGWAIIGVAVLIGLSAVFARRRRRPSLDDALRRRRPE
jgi:LPXTG-motif cell wall-anchored protein